jgi:hypothetical protein
MMAVLADNRAGVDALGQAGSGSLLPAPFLIKSAKIGQNVL